MRILILGASGFIGQELIGFLGKEHELFLIDREPSEAMGNVEINQLDVTIEETFREYLDAIPDSEFPTAMINLSGRIVSRSILNPEQFKKSRKLIDINEHLGDFDSNFIPQIVPMLCFSEQLVKRKIKGKIINFSSLNSKPTQGQLGYSTAKKSIESSSQVLALELGLFGISVNCIAPGFIDLPNLKSNMSDEGISQITQNAALKRLVVVEDVFHAINFLLMAKSISGTTLHVHSTVS